MILDARKDEVVRTMLIFQSIIHFLFKANWPVIHETFFELLSTLDDRYILGLRFLRLSFIGDVVNTIKITVPFN